MNDENHTHQDSRSRSAFQQEAPWEGRTNRSRRPGLLGLALMLNLLLWFSISCSGDLGSVMGVDDPARELAGVLIEPASTTLEVGSSRVLSAVYTDEQGNEHPEEVTWTSLEPEVAGVSEDGQVTAHAAGTAVIVASTEEGEDGSATVEVVAAGEGGSGSGAVSHEPDGFELLTERGFDRAVEDGWSSSGGLDMQIVSDHSAPRSPSNVGRIRYPEGFEGGRTPSFTTREGFEDEGYTELYVSFWLKLSDNWQGHESGVNKIGFIWVHDNAVVFPANIISEGDGVTPRIMLQRTPDGARNLSLNVNDIRVERGEWVHWEILLVSNTGDSRNGEAHWWIDGEKVGEHTDIIYGDSGQDDRWQTVAWRPTWGGRGDVVKEEMHMWMDHIYVSGAR